MHLTSSSRARYQTVQKMAHSDVEEYFDRDDMNLVQKERPKLSDLQETLYPIRSKWYQFGVQLQVPTDTLNSIQQSAADLNLLQMLSEWEKQMESQGGVTWVAVVEALRRQSIGENQLARRVIRQWCKWVHVDSRGSIQEEMVMDQSDYTPANGLELTLRPSSIPTEVPHHICMEIKSKMKWFNRLRRRAFNDIQRSGTTANDFRVFVLDPSLPWEDEDRRAIIRADQVATICAVISHSKYLNWYHSDLLEDIVKEYGSNTLQGDMEEYCAEKSEMEQRFSLENVKNVVLCPACSHDVTIQAFVPRNCKMSDMRRVCNGYSRRNGIPEMLCRVHTAASNSPLAIMLLLPYDAALKLRPPLPLPWSIDVLPEKIEDRCICILSEEETLQLIEGSPVPPLDLTLPPTSPSSSLSTPAHPLARSTPSINSQDSHDPRPKVRNGQSLDMDFVDSSRVQVFNDLVLDKYGSSAVYRAQIDLLPCAAKCIHQEIREYGDWQLERFMEGCKFLQGCHHPNIVMFLAMHYDISLEVPVLLMELMDESLQHFLKRATGPVPLHTQLDICHDIAQGLQYIHSRGYIHGDVTVRNVLLQGSRAKLGGMMTLQQKSPDVEHFCCPGTPAFMPLRSFSFNDYDETIDCFSLGVVNICIATRELPLPTSDPTEAASNMVEVQRYEESIAKMDVNHPLHPMILRCLSDDRPSAADLCTELSALKTSELYRMSMQVEQLAGKLKDLHIHFKQEQINEKQLIIKQLILEKDTSRDKATASLQQYQHKVEQLAIEAQQKDHALQENTEKLKQVKDKLQYNDKVHLRKVEELQNEARRVKGMEEELEKAVEERTKLEQDTKQAIDRIMKEKEQVRSSYEKQSHQLTATERDKDKLQEMLQTERKKSEDAREELRVKLEELEKHNIILKEQLAHSDSMYTQLLNSQAAEET